MNPQEIYTQRVRNRRVIVGIDWGYVSEILVSRPLVKAYSFGGTIGLFAAALYKLIDMTK